VNNKKKLHIPDHTVPHTNAAWYSVVMAESVNTSVRIPAELHERLQREAQRQDRSVNYLVVQFIRRGLSQDMPGGLSKDQPGGLSAMFGELLRSIAGGGQVPGNPRLDELLKMALDADDRRFTSRL
jgi:hypothetical protein